jgi:ribose 5-phosphate isomerase B
MKIAFGCDHAAFEHRDKVIDVLKAQGHTVEDFGHKGKDSCDYPDIAAAVAGSVSKGKNEKGILICGTGVGMSIAANKFPRVRAAVCWNKSVAALVSEHNDANILCLPARFSTPVEMTNWIDLWLKTPRSAEQRHINRINKIAAIEKLNFKLGI